MVAVRPAALALGAAAWLAGCTALLPTQKAETLESWSSYDEARAAIERIVAYESRRTELAAQGIDPYRNPAISILTYSDVVQRFAVGSSVRPEELDRGLRECLSAGKLCSGYQIDVHRTDRNRVGNFWLDLFNFRRDVDVTGWSFRALILFVDDTVVYTLHGGQPRLHEQEVSRNPLGPLQGWGESAGSRILDR